MRKPMLLILLVLLIGGGYYLYNNAGAIITRQAEKIASDALGVKVTIGHIDLTLSDKKVTVSNIAIANPPGYQNPYAITVQTIAIGLNTASRELIDFNNIEVKGSVVNLEMTEHGININDLKKRSNRKEQRESTGSKQIRVIVQHMMIDATTVNPTISMLGNTIPPIHMPPLRMSNIGKGDGIDAGDAISQIVSQYASEIENAARNSGILKGIPGNLGDVQKTMGNTADGVSTGLQKLFK